MADWPETTTVTDLSRAFVTSNSVALLDVASDVPHEYWTEEHFLVDLPMKWTLSFVLLHDARPIAYAILSAKENKRCHLHHLMVHRDWRGGTLGCHMLDEVRERALRAGMLHLTLKIAADNARARDFYVEHGFSTAAVSGDYHMYEMHL